MHVITIDTMDWEISTTPIHYTVCSAYIENMELLDNISALMARTNSKRIFDWLKAWPTL